MKFKDPDALAENSIKESSRMDSVGSGADSKLFESNREDMEKNQATFIDIFNDPELRLRRGRTVQLKYYDALAQRYKYLLKWNDDEDGAKNLLKSIEEQILYGNNVKTFRIINGIMQEVLQDNYTQTLMKEIDSVETEVTDGRFSVTVNKEEEYKILKSRLKTKNDLRKLIDEIPYPASVSAIRPVKPLLSSR